MTHEQEQTKSIKSDQADNEGPQCWACSETLIKGQKFCTNCSNWQGRFRRHLNFSNTILTLFVALFAVIGSMSDRLFQALRSEPKPSIYVFGQLNENWSQIELKVENLNELDRVLPFVFDCTAFGAIADLNFGTLRYYNRSSTLIRGEDDLLISYNVDPKTQLPETYDVSTLPLSGLNCSGNFSGNDAKSELTIIFNNQQSIRFDLDHS